MSVVQPLRYIRYVISVSLVAEIVYAFSKRGVWTEGHFDNPAGFATFVVAGFPFLYYIDYIQRNSYIRHSIEIIFMAIMFATGSRAGIIALIFVIGLSYYKKRHWECNIWIKTAAATILCIFLIILYLLKKDSADGRVLIWRCTYNMIAQKPIWGYGADGFRKYYMNFQEQYFAENPDSVYANLADNIVHPFNEYLQIIVNYGFVGLGVFFLFIVLLFYISKKEDASGNYDAVLSLTGIGVIALFSYPFSYTVCRCFIVYNIIVITGLWRIFIINPKPLRALIICFVMIAVGAVYWQSRTVKKTAYQTWHKLHSQSFDNMADKREFYEAGEILDNAEFWYELGARFYFFKMYDDCLFALNRSENLNNNTDVQILKGICLADLGKSDLAELHYKSAHNMCPKLIKPLYLLVKLYEQTGDSIKARSMALQVLDKKEKVKTFESDEMKDELKKYIND